MNFAVTLCFRPQRGGSGLPSQSRLMLPLTRKHKRTEGENREVQGRSASPDVPESERYV